MNKHIYKINNSRYIKDEFRDNIFKHYNVTLVGIDSSNKNKIVIYVMEDDYARLCSDFEEDIKKGWIEIFSQVGKTNFN